MISLINLAIGLGIDKSNLCKIIKKLGISHTLVRGRRNQWEYYFSNGDVEKIIRYREGISHYLVKDEEGNWILQF